MFVSSPVIFILVQVKRLRLSLSYSVCQEQIPIGAADVRAIFSSGSGRVAGCMVTEGKVLKGCGVRVIRNGKTVYVGTLDSLKRVKEMFKEVFSEPDFTNLCTCRLKID